MKKAIFIILFFLIAPVNLGVSLFALSRSSSVKQVAAQAQSSIDKIASSEFPSKLYAALPTSVGEVLGVVDSSDARPVIIKKYLRKHKSPLLPYSGELLQASEKYNVDYRLIVAIAQCESNLCKKSPEDSYNCWGFENGETKFLSWEQALDQVAKTLREEYFDKGYETPEEIMYKYAPPSVDKGGPWAKCVNQFIEELEYGRVD